MKTKNKLKSRNVLLVLGLIYTLITILATTSYVSTMKNISTTPVTFGTIINAMWWQILMIILFIGTYIIYMKNEKLGALSEIIMAISMLGYIIVSIISVGANLLAITIELIYPIILIAHCLVTFKTVNKKLKKSTN